MSDFPTRLEYNTGSDHDPGDPFGRVRLVHQKRTWTAKINPQTLATLWAALERGGFPTIPRHPLRAGSALRTVLAHVGDAKVGGHVAFHEAEKLDGYKEAFPILDSLVRQVSGDVLKHAPNTLPPVVSDVVCETT